MLLRDFVELGFGRLEFLAVLLFQNVRVELKEPQDLGYVLRTNVLEVGHQVLHCLQQIFVHLRPFCGEIKFKQDADDQGELFKGILIHDLI